MATGGRRPKPARLRLVDGSFRKDRHGAKAEAIKSAGAAASAFGKIERPTWLKGEPRRAWDEFIAPATWLDGSRTPAAVVFCELWAEFRSSPRVFQSARYAQLRAVMADLGLSDERNRAPSPTGENDEFF